MNPHVNNRPSGLPSLMGFDASAAIEAKVFSLHAPADRTRVLGDVMPGFKSRTVGAPTYSAAQGSTAFDSFTRILYVNLNGGFLWAAIDLSQYTPKSDFDDLERRFRLLLADYIDKFGPVASLEDENARALEEVL